MTEFVIYGKCEILNIEKALDAHWNEDNGFNATSLSCPLRYYDWRNGMSAKPEGQAKMKW